MNIKSRWRLGVFFDKYLWY